MGAPRFRRGYSKPIANVGQVKQPMIIERAVSVEGQELKV